MYFHMMSVAIFKAEQTNEQVIYGDYSSLNIINLCPSCIALLVEPEYCVIHGTYQRVYRCSKDIIAGVTCLEIARATR
jgi:hypothetical protein